ncbi:2-dehydropantoate 2-reductase [Bacillus sp. FJAT-47783]|uniref:2-dehydropantoate 2-reductase n=1 Tax=Bacillus sp. FJAT-47783 TaxID=2922712 RepID=UPI001FABB774|nr:2-dehydropantoate 2-reductase [Bacillus sp. FJAT-47783]
MKVGVIGGGAVGLLLAGNLSAKHEVTVYTRTKEQACVLSEKGIEIVGEYPFNTKVSRATNSANYEEDVLFVTVKQYQLRTVVENLKTLPSRTVIFLQNGMAHIDYLEHLKHHDLILGVVEHGVLKQSEHTIKHTGMGRIVLAPYHLKSMTILEQLQEEIERFPIETTNHWYTLLAKKLLANAVINPLTAIWNVQNGELIENGYFRRAMEQLFNEVWEVLHLSGKEEHFEYIKTICQKTANNRSSMLKDLDENRETEIEAILGYLLQEANKKYLSLPLLSFLYETIKGLETK